MAGGELANPCLTKYSSGSHLYIETFVLTFVTKLASSSLCYADAGNRNTEAVWEKLSVMGQASADQLRLSKAGICVFIFSFSFGLMNLDQM